MRFVWICVIGGCDGKVSENLYAWWDDLFPAPGADTNAAGVGGRAGVAALGVVRLLRQGSVCKRTPSVRAVQEALAAEWTMDN